MAKPNTPIIIGVADIKNRSTSLSSAKEPATLMLEAIHAALADTSCPCIPDLQAGIDSIDVVRTWTWPYEDLAGLLAGELGVGSGKGEEGKKGGLKWKRTSEHGGDKPGKLFDEAAKRVASGECRVAVVTGGEALASCTFLPLVSLSLPARGKMREGGWLSCAACFFFLSPIEFPITLQINSLY